METRSVSEGSTINIAKTVSVHPSLTLRVSIRCLAQLQDSHFGASLGIAMKSKASVKDMGDPIAFFLTWVTYGTWLPGDARGWVEYKQGWHLPSRTLETDCELRMSEDAVRLTLEQRGAVERQIEETCRLRGWILHAVNCRTNHIHTVVNAPDTPPKKIRVDLKAYSARCLKSLDETRDNWWAERGSIRWVFSEDDLDSVVKYVLDGQEWRPNL